jgi:hypothetical protein
MTYQTPSGIPLSKINLGRREAIPDMDNRGAASLAEAGSSQLEMKYLSEISGEGSYWKAAERVMEAIREQPSMEGLLPIFVRSVGLNRYPSFEHQPVLEADLLPSLHSSPETGQFFASEIRLGSRGDSYYEVRSPPFSLLLSTSRSR